MELGIASNPASRAAWMDIFPSAFLKDLKESLDAETIPELDHGHSDLLLEQPA